jgi:hypothetical protein
VIPTWTNLTAAFALQAGAEGAFDHTAPVPRRFGRRCGAGDSPRSSFDTGWVFLAIVSVVFAFVGLAGRNPRQTLDALSLMSLLSSASSFGVTTGRSAGVS